MLPETTSEPFHNARMFERIFHPSDFTETSQLAFCHALKIALAANAELRMLHVNVAGERSHHCDFPSVREFLQQWKILPEGSTHRAVGRLGIDIRKSIVSDSNAVAGVLEFLEDNPSTLIVLATHRRGELHWFGHSRAEPIARNSRVATLFVPDGARGFVDPDNGELHLRNILVPIALKPASTATMGSIFHLADILELNGTRVHFLHVGTEATLPALPRGAKRGITLHTHICSGDPVSVILEKSRELQADLVAMTTDGHHGFLDALRGNTTERVLRQLDCPLWAVSSG